MQGSGGGASQTEAAKFKTLGRVQAWHPRGTEKEDGESRVTEGSRGGSLFFLST